MRIANIGIGSNVGDRESFCRRAVAALEETPGVKIEAVSSLYETTPVGGPPQRSYVNLVVRAFTDLEAAALLSVCKDIEHRLGRDASDIRWGPRVIDLDILTYGEQRVAASGLEVPHPRLHERRFALVPLLEVDPDARDPNGVPYAASLDDAEGEVVRLRDPT
jgi:2-amino-4-hydroxy-6-hydroxymethyldihydropteridine diphosphokinase